MRFEKISKKQFDQDFDSLYNCQYEEINLPRRATTGSAGYDFYSPIDFSLHPGKTIKIPTGIRIKIPQGYFLMMVPRSGLGFKYRLQLDNTVGIIDCDYYDSDNEGHIWIKLTNDTYEGKTLTVKKGTAIAQGIILPYGVTEDDDVDEVRNGGFGSTSKSTGNDIILGQISFIKDKAEKNDIHK